MTGRKIECMRANPKVCIEVEELPILGAWKMVLAFGEFEELTSVEHASAREYAYFLLQKNNSNWWEPGAISVRPGLGASKSSPDYFRVHIDRMSGRQGTKG